MTKSGAGHCTYALLSRYHDFDQLSIFWHKSSEQTTNTSGHH